MSRFRAILVGLALAVVTLITWEVGAAIHRIQKPEQPPSTATLPVVP